MRRKRNARAARGACRVALVIAILASGLRAEASLPPAPIQTSTQATLRDPKALIERAMKLETEGDLDAARKDWLAASALFEVGADREGCVGRARELEMRQSLRTEIIDAVPRDARVFAEIQIERAYAAGVVMDGKPRGWNEVPLDTLRRASAIARASKPARAGLLFEILARGAAAEKDEALIDLGHMLERKEIEAFDAWPAVARSRSEKVPRRGYVFRDNRWRNADELAQAAQDAGLEDIAKRFETAPIAQRDGLYAALEKLGPEAEARFQRALEARWSNAIKALTKGATMEQLTAIAASRKDIDVKRKAALELIFDEEKYFYPYSPPECPAEKAKLYAGVQQKVDELVSAVREVWKDTHHVKLPAAFRDALDELAWNRAKQEKQKLAFALPETVPPWIGGLDPAIESVELRSFAWDAKERARLALDRAVLALNERNWSKSDYDAVHAANNEERRQVEITNEYRLMLGRCALAWNAKLQASAQKHSDYIANTGDFGHMEPDPERHTPENRMRLEGYKNGSGENCAAGDTGAEGAHVGWCHSSGHHRNILDAAHHEMGSAISSEYWTQNFGDGNEFQQEIRAP